MSVINRFSWWAGCPPVAQRVRNACCMPLAKPPKRPDPYIYSQDEHHAAGRPVTWDNPDILSLTGWGADARTISEIKVTVHNASNEVPAIGVVVSVNYAAFGIGFPRRPLSQSSVNLNPGASSSLHFAVLQAIRDAHPLMAVGVKLFHPYDSKTSNNKGSQSVFREKIRAGTEYTLDVPIYNASSSPKRYQLRLDNSAWNAVISSAMIDLQPFTEGIVTLSVNPDSNQQGEQRFNITAYDGVQLHGGLWCGLAIRED